MPGVWATAWEGLICIKRDFFSVYLQPLPLLSYTPRFSLPCQSRCAGKNNDTNPKPVDVAPATAVRWQDALPYHPPIIWFGQPLLWWAMAGGPQTFSVTVCQQGSCELAVSAILPIKIGIYQKKISAIGQTCWPLFWLVLKEKCSTVWEDVCVCRCVSACVDACMF